MNVSNHNYSKIDIPDIDLQLDEVHLYEVEIDEAPEEAYGDALIFVEVGGVRRDLWVSFILYRDPRSVRVQGMSWGCCDESDLAFDEEAIEDRLYQNRGEIERKIERSCW